MECDPLYCFFWMSKVEVVCMKKGDWGTWVQAIAACLGLVGIVVAAIEVTKRSRIENALRSVFIKYLKSTINNLAEYMEIYSGNFTDNLWQKAFDDRLIAELSRASEKPDWVGLEISSLAREVLIAIDVVKSINKDIQEKDGRAILANGGDEEKQLWRNMVLEMLNELVPAMRNKVKNLHVALKALK